MSVGATATDAPARDPAAAGILARIGRWCFSHRWLVLAVWAAVAAGGTLASETVSAALVGSSPPRDIESIQGRDVAIAAQGATAGQVIGLVDGVDQRAAPVRDAVEQAARDLAGQTGVAAAYTGFTPGLTPEQAAAYTSSDGRGVLIVAELGDVDRHRRDAVVDAVADRMHALGDALRARGQPDARVLVGGEAAIERQGIQAEERDLDRGEELSLPITVVLLIVVFGGLVAAGTPVLAALVSVATAMIALLGFSRLTDLNANVLTVVTVLGLALSIDYTLLLVGRYREELLAGSDPETAIGRTWATAGRTILFSGFTMAAALSGLLLFNLPVPFALGIAGMSTALIAVLVALTLTGPVLSLGRRRIRPSRRARRAGAAASTPAEAGFFFRLSGLVQRRPVLITAVTVTLLLLAGAPLLTTTFRLSGPAGLPPGTEAVDVEHALVDRFGWPSAAAVTVIAQGNVDITALDRWAARWAGEPAVNRVEPARSLGPGVAAVTFDIGGNPQSAPAQNLVSRLRADRPTGVRSWVTGDAAVLIDTLGRIGHGLPWAAAVTVLAMTVLLFAMTGSLVVPVKAILANAISLLATFGVLNAVFQHGWLAGPLDTLPLGGLDPFMMVIIFAFAFGISVDYEVFLLARIREYAAAGSDDDDAVRRGLQHTGRIITSAALVMVIVFACFGGARTGEIEQLGIGLSVAIVVDATIVRCLLVPSTMTLLGRWVWWAPAPLRRLSQRLRRFETRRPGVGPDGATGEGHEQVVPAQ